MKRFLLLAVLSWAVLAQGQYVPRQPTFAPRPVFIPTGLGWDTVNFPLVFTVTDIPPPSPGYGTSSDTPEALFNRFSTALSAPTNTYYIAPSTATPPGLDTNTGADAAHPWLSIHKALTAANTAAAPAKIIVAAGTFVRANNPTNGGSVLPTVDIALVASGGRVITGPFDAYSAPSLDGTNTNCYTFAVSNVDRVMDMTNRDRYGNYTDLINVATAAICNVTPNSWAIIGNANIFIHRVDGAAVTNANTRVYRSGTGTLKVTSQVSIYVGGAAANDGFDFESGGTGGCLFVQPATGTAGSLKAVVAKNSSFKYAGGIISTDGKGVYMDSLWGIAAFFNCDASANYTDGFNFHDIRASSQMYALTLNCTARDNGRGNSSCNGWTSHENVIGIDVGGDFRRNRGGTVRSIGTSKTLFAGAVVQEDFGDIMFGGTLPPTAISTSGTYWLDGVKIDMPGGAYGIRSESGGTIYTRNLWPYRNVNDPGTGTITSY